MDQEFNTFKERFHEIFSNSSWKKRGRYTNGEISFFKEYLEYKIRVAKENYSFSRENFAEGNSTRGTDPSFKDFSNASESIWFGQNVHVIDSQSKLIKSLEKALARIEQGRYGFSLLSGKIIPPGRLFSAPHATLNVEEKSN